MSKRLSKLSENKKPQRGKKSTSQNGLHTDSQWRKNGQS